MTPKNTVNLSRTTRRGGALKGCLIVLLIVGLIAGVAAWFVATHWKGWTASGVKTIAEEGINQSDLPAAEKPEMIAEVEAFAADFESGVVPTQQFFETIKGLSEGPLFPVGMVYAVDEGFIKPSGLSDEDKAAGTRALQRFARGLYESSLDMDDYKVMAKPIGYEDADGTFHLNPKTSVNDDMVRQAIANAKAKADEIGIADEPFVVDLSDELKKKFDKARASSAP